MRHTGRRRQTSVGPYLAAGDSDPSSGPRTPLASTLQKRIRNESGNESDRPRQTRFRMPATSSDGLQCARQHWRVSAPHRPRSTLRDTSRRRVGAVRRRGSRRSGPRGARRNRPVDRFRGLRQRRAPTIQTSRPRIASATPEHAQLVRHPLYAAVVDHGRRATQRARRRPAARARTRRRYVRGRGRRSGQRRSFSWELTGPRVGRV